MTAATTGASSASHAPDERLFVVAIAVSAFLLFLVQPIVAKQLLPWLRGSSAVWLTCRVFFQVMLLAGYTYAHLLTSRLRRCLESTPLGGGVMANWFETKVRRFVASTLADAANVADWAQAQALSEARDYLASLEPSCAIRTSTATSRYWSPTVHSMTRTRPKRKSLCSPHRPGCCSLARP